MRDRSSSVKPESDGPGPEGTNVLFDIWLLSRATHGLLDDALADAGLTADEFGVYSVLTKSDTTTPTDLATWMCAPPTTVSSYVKRMQARGHVIREPHPTDGRSSVLRLTPDGHRAWEAAGTAFLPVLAEVESALGSKVDAIRRSLAQASDAVRSASQA